MGRFFDLKSERYPLAPANLNIVKEFVNFVYFRHLHLNSPFLNQLNFNPILHHEDDKILFASGCLRQRIPSSAQQKVF